MNTLKGKRLLVLGGNSWANAIRDYTRKNGVVMIAAGNNPNTQLFELADECLDVDTTDSETMKQLILSRGIDGVYLGGNEPVINKACEYVNALGLPCYCTKQQWERMQNKRLFKQCCMEAGLPVVPQYNLSEESLFLEEGEFPVITKPVDGCGSNGFSVCRNNAELKEGYKRAAENSDSGNVIVEKYVNNQGHVVFYTVTEGKIVFSGLSDKYPVKFEKQGSYVGGLFVYESRFVNEFRQKFEDRIQKLVSQQNIQEGTFWIEVFHDGDEYYFNEAGFRYGGSVSIYPVDYLHGINQVASDIYYALTGQSKLYGHDPLFGPDTPKKNHYAIYPVYVKPGTIAAFDGLEELKENASIVQVLKARSVGAVIDDTGSFGQAVLLIHMVFDTHQELSEIIGHIHDTLKVRGVSGDNLVTQMIDLSRVTIGQTP